MQPEEPSGERQNPRSRLRRAIQGALDTASYAPDLPMSAVDAIADAIIKRAPGPGELAGVVREGLEAAGTGAEFAAETAGEVAKAIAEVAGDAAGSL
jgi:hypothetical protein